MSRPAIDVRALLVLVVQLGLTGWLGFLGATLPFDNRIERFAVHHGDQPREHEIFQRLFGHTDFFLVALDLGADPDEALTGRAETWFGTMAETPGVADWFSMARLPSGDQELDPEFVPFPFFQPSRGIYTALFQIEPGLAQGRVVTTFQRAAREAERDGLARRAVVAGEPVVNEALNRSSMEVKEVFFPILILWALVLLGFLFRDWKVLVVSGLSIGSSLACTTGIMAQAGSSMNLVTTLIPALVFVLSLAMQVHVLVSIGLKKSIEGGLRDKWWPNFLVSLTTSLGFGSLMTSSVAPISAMGGYMAIGIWIIFFWAHVTHLGLSKLLGLAVRPPSLSPLRNLQNLSWYQGLIASRWFLWIPVAVIGLGGWVLVRNPTESNGLNYFSPDHPIRVQTRFLQENVTGASHLELLVPLPEVVAGDEDKDEDGAVVMTAFLERQERLTELETRLVGLEDVHHVLSFNQFLNAPLRAEGMLVTDLEAEDRRALAEHLRDTRPELFTRFVQGSHYRLQLLVNSLDRERYGALASELKRLSPPDSLITGPLARIIEIQHYLLRSLSTSLSLTVAAVVLLLLLLFGRKARPWTLMIPNLFPLGCVALAMFLFEIKTSISTVMVFSIAFGIAVDDTVHLLNTFYRNDSEAFELRWRRTLEKDARAVFLTTLVLTLGFAVLMTSSFGPTRAFGLLLGVGMVFAFLGDLWFLPLLLGSPRLMGRSPEPD
ncbi:MMPL family transporter [Sulfidibacter corallicola]|uniref:MMPL family transporter n=1 Tax=Sulfidibacter corallicola TaxID=2818388 RepID=A0A8A4TT18_SULCO|nr:MMPL family transporter [Sulfidibacter corallicola]QTD52680.1 MMPL family transporter [Sulfidibacter corallicola]